MKKTIPTILVSMALGGAVFVGVQLSAQSNLVTFDMQVTDKPNGEHVLNYISPTDGGLYSMSFFNEDSFKEMTETCERDKCRLRVDPSDPEDTKYIRSIFYDERKNKDYEQILDELKGGVEYNHTKSDSSIESKPSQNLEKIISFFATPAYATEYRLANFPGSMVIAATDDGGKTGFALDSAFVAGTSGDSLAVYHGARKTVSNVTVTAEVECTAVTGTPDSYTAYIYGGATGAGDPDRPNIAGGALYTSAVVDASGCGTAQWKTFTFSNVSLTAGLDYWVLIVNTHASPTTNFATFTSRGGLDQAGTNYTSLATTYPHQCFTSTNGWSADGTGIGGAVCTIILNYGSESFGNPYVNDNIAHASNQNHRGNRFTPIENMYINSVQGSFDSNLSTTTIAQGASKVTDQKLTVTELNRVGGGPITPLLATKATDYDILQTPAANDTFGAIFCMGNSPTASVKAAGGPLRYVEGATLGSLSLNDECVYSMMIEIGENPAITGGGGGTSEAPHLEVKGTLNVLGSLEVK